MSRDYTNNIGGVQTLYKKTSTTPFGGKTSSSKVSVNTITWADNVTVRTGSNGADWQRKLSNGLVTGGMEVSTYSLRLEVQGHANRTVRRKSDGFVIAVSMDSPFSGTSFAALPPGSLYDKVYNAAATDFINRLKADQETMLLVVLGEAQASATTLSDYGRKLVASLLGFRTAAKQALTVLLKKFIKDEVRAQQKRPSKRRRQSAVRRWTTKSTKMLSQEWLAFSYGLKPILSDIDGVLDAHFSGSFPERRKVRSADTRTAGATKAPVSFLRDTDTNLRVQTTHVSTKTCTVKLMSLLEVLHPTIASNARYGLGPSDFIPSLWELVPWSFLVDIVSNTGEVIEAASYYSCNPTVAQLTVYTKEEQVTVANMMPGQAPAGYELLSESSSQSIVKAKRVTISRKRVVNPVPSLSLSYDPSLYQVMSLSALAAIPAMRALDKQWADDAARQIASHPSIGYNNH